MTGQAQDFAAPTVADRQLCWVDRLPQPLRDFALLARWDRPIGTWLLLLPCWWGLALGDELPDIRLLLLFGIGAIAMRGAGCTVNDMADREFDRMVERTRNRPLAAGRLGVKEALAFLAAQLLVGLGVLLQLEPAAILVGLLSLPLIVLYPFMKRITWWPQAFLGITFNWGLLVGYAHITGGLAWPAALAYAAGIAWTLGYDTIYAHQDKSDDLIVGIKSTALRLGGATPRWLVIFYTIMMALLVIAGLVAGKGILFYLMLPAVVWSLYRQVRRLDLDDPEDCLGRFRMNRTTGLLVFAALALGSVEL